MKSIMIVGGSGTFLSELINKFAKEDWQIFTLVGERSTTKPAYVFEQYSFEPTSSSVWEVIASCRPNLILYMGAYDPSFRWGEMSEKEDAQRYVAGLSNILLAGQAAGVPRFLYLSGDCVFGENVSGLRTEDDAAAPSDLRAAVIRQGEVLALSQGENSQMQVQVLRLPEITFIPRSTDECRGGIAALCLEAIQSGCMQASASRMFSYLYVSDAVRAVHLLAQAATPSRRLYHVEATTVESEYNLACMVSKASGHEIPIEEGPEEESVPARLSGDLFASEFGYSARVSSAQAVQLIYRAMATHRNRFGAKPRPTLFKGFLKRVDTVFRKFYPFLECMVLIMPVYLISTLSQGLTFLGGINFYLLYVLLFALLRGRQLAIFAFALSVLAHVHGIASAGGVAQMLIDYKTYAWILELFVVGIFAGGLRDRLALIESEKNEERDFLTARLNDITAINQSNTRLKNYFQELTINSNESIGWFYEIIQKLDNADSSEVVFIAPKILSQILGVRDVAIYTNTRYGYMRLMASTTPEAQVMGKSIRREDHPQIFEVMEDGGIYINRTLNRGLPSMASSLTDANGNSAFVFFLWNVPYEKMTLYYANLLRVAVSLIYNALMRSARYLDALSYKRYIPGTSALQPEAFAEMCAIHRKVRDEGMTEFCVLELPAAGSTIEDWCERLRPLLRSSDLVGQLDEDRIGILLLNTSADEARFVIERLQHAGIEVRIQAES